MIKTLNNGLPLFRAIRRLKGGMGPFTHVTVIVYSDCVVVMPGFRIGQEMLIDPKHRQVIPHAEVSKSVYYDVIAEVLAE